jgi:hypothetical protein
VGTGPRSLCITCHAEGDKGYNTAQGIASDLARLNSSLRRSEGTLNTAERSGMEVSSGRVELGEAHEALVKARVDVHTINEAEVRKLTEQGVETSLKAYEAGLAALRERDFRRKGLGVALIAIVLAMSGLYLKIREIESRDRPES